MTNAGWGAARSDRGRHGHGDRHGAGPVDRRGTRWRRVPRRTAAAADGDSGDAATTSELCAVADGRASHRCTNPRCGSDPARTRLGLRLGRGADSGSGPARTQLGRDPRAVAAPAGAGGSRRHPAASNDGWSAVRGRPDRTFGEADPSGGVMSVVVRRGASDHHPSGAPATPVTISSVTAVIDPAYGLPSVS
jgi:hypothetical protein